jgi:hypothetical protein
MWNDVFEKLGNGFDKQTEEWNGMYVYILAGTVLWCETWGSHSSVVEDSSILGCDAVSDEWFKTFWRTIVPSTTGSSSWTYLALLDCDYEHITILQNVRQYPSNDSAFHPSRFQSSIMCCICKCREFNGSVTQRV